MPQHLIANGTIVRLDTGYIAPGAPLFCPFLVFERTFGQREQRLETANNQCAIAGAWCTRSLQMLYAKAWSPADRHRPDLPVSFSCTIDNEIAILNYHWIDGAQSYCMSPICKFDLANDDHFHQFNVWIEAIGQWGLRTLLPNLKRALASIQEHTLPEVPAAPEEILGNKPELKLDTVLQEDKLVTALKSSFSHTPWRLEDDDFTPVSSSVASWGSPIIHDFYYNSLQYPCVPRMKSSSSSSVVMRDPLDSKMNSAVTVVAQPRPQAPQRRFKIATPLTPTALPMSFNASTTGGMTPPPSYLAPNAELACQKRLTHAMDEIQDLQAQLQRIRQEMSGLSMSYQTELSGLKNTVTTLLRKEVMGPASAGPCLRGRSTSSPIVPNISTMNVSLTTKDVYTDLQQTRQQAQASVITTPTDPKPKSYSWDRLRQNRSRSSLQQVMTINTSTGAITSQQADEDIPEEEEQQDESDTKPHLIEAPLPSATSMPPTAKTTRFQLTPGPMSAAFPSPAFSISARSDVTNVLVVPPPPPKTSDVLKWTAALLGAQTLGTFISTTVVRVVFLGCITDFALLAFASPHWPSTTRYFMELLKNSQS
ncbi:hypothetical protein OHC33_001743 [Knufia fluminis]|uniref:DUF7924 domain-containing protein n=1 Tax=Knufia fluminis TaxID=191047 RepID=A0AAN8EN52_9EURO|nr:hypothetical protein OHC33_001743 [Knufia fluminis]